MFNVYLPKLLEKRLGATGEGSRKEALWDIVVFTLGGCPGALVRNPPGYRTNVFTHSYRLAHG